MDINNNTLLKQIAIVLFLIVFVFGMYNSKNRNGDSQNCIQKFKRFIYNGVVGNKYIDSTNHNYKTFEYERTKNNKIHIVNEKTGFYEKIKIKDSLVFNLETNVYYIYRFGNLVDSDTISFDCN